MSFSKVSEIIEASQSRQIPFWKVILDDDVEERKVTEKESFFRMEKMLDDMQNGMQENVKSPQSQKSQGF